MDSSPDAVSMAMSTHSNAESILALMIPIIAITLGIGVAMLSLWLDYRKKRDIFELHHKERLAAIEKGMDVPPLPPELFQSMKRNGRTASDYLRRGLVWGLIGVALSIALRQEHESGASYALIPVAIGAANLLMFLFHRKDPPAASQPSGSGPNGPALR